MGLLEEADLALVFVRRRALPVKQMRFLREYVGRGKPLLGLRTASHAFDARGAGPKGFMEWKDFDPEGLGGNYHGHYRGGPETTVKAAAGAGGHPILAGVTLPFTSKGSLYKTGPLVKGTRLLLTGSIPGEESEPVAWTHRFGNSRVFYSSLGYPADFKESSFVKMLTNAIFWGLERPVEKVRIAKFRP